MKAPNLFFALALAIFSFAIGAQGEEAKKPAGQTYDGYGGDSKQGMGPGVSVMPAPDKPDEVKVPTEKEKPKKMSAKKKKTGTRQDSKGAGGN